MRACRLWLIWAALLPIPALALEQVELRRDGRTTHVTGKVVVRATDGGMLLRGEDRFGHFQQVPSPDADLSAQAMEWHARILRAQNDTIYDGAAQGPG